MYKKILVPVDGSEPSNFALEHGINLAKQCKENNNTSFSSKINVIMSLYYMLFQKCQLQ